MSLSALAEFYEKQPEPRKGMFLYLRDYFLKFHSDITAEWKYRLPFFYYRGKMLCYLWYDKTSGEPYIGFAHGRNIEHDALVSGDRKWVKIFPLSVAQDIPIETLSQVLDLAMKNVDSKIGK